MIFVYDVAKDSNGRAKHRIPLAASEALFAEPHTSFIDDRFEYGEKRQIAIGHIDGRMFICVFVDRGAERRLISLRKANPREVNKYGKGLLEGRP